MKRIYLPDDELFEKGFTALVDTLGWVDAIRFLRLNDAQKGGDYTKDRRIWQTQLDRKTFFDQIFDAPVEQ